MYHGSDAEQRAYCQENELVSVASSGRLNASREASRLFSSADDPCPFEPWNNPSQEYDDLFEQPCTSMHDSGDLGEDASHVGVALPARLAVRTSFVEGAHCPSDATAARSGITSCMQCACASIQKVTVRRPA